MSEKNPINKIYTQQKKTPKLKDLTKKKNLENLNRKGIGRGGGREGNPIHTKLIKNRAP
jgi:hypothetical protein